MGYQCMNDDGNQAALLVTNLDAGDTVAVCVLCLPAWAAAMVETFPAVEAPAEIPPCPVCGAQVDPADAEAHITAHAAAGELGPDGPDQDDGEGPGEGDKCPQCGALVPLGGLKWHWRVHAPASELGPDDPSDDDGHADETPAPPVEPGQPAEPAEPADDGPDAHVTDLPTDVDKPVDYLPAVPPTPAGVAPSA